MAGVGESGQTAFENAEQEAAYSFGQLASVRINSKLMSKWQNT
jgi:hypothetical protein